MNILFDKQTYDFGTVPEKSVLETVFFYHGTEPLSASDFQPTCQCTQGVYYPQTREYHVGLKSEGKGLKQTNIVVKGSYYLILKANIV